MQFRSITLAFLCSLLLATWMLHSTCQADHVTEDLSVDEMVVVVIDSVDVPANRTGSVKEIVVREGQTVTAGQLLGRLDDREARLGEQVARTQLEIESAHAQSDLASELAAKKMAGTKQQAKEHEVILKIATENATNEHRVLASRKAESVAKNELDRAMQSRQQYVESVSRSEIDGLRLEYEKTRLETKQAEFERAIDALRSKAEQEAAESHRLNVEQSEIELEQALTESEIEQLQVKLREHQSKIAALAVEKHQFASPIDGVVAEVYSKKGVWVNSGEPVVRVVRLNRLRAEGFVPFERLNALRQNREVTLIIQAGPDATIDRLGTVVFISPEIDPVSQEVRFWVEFDNPNLDVLPGMRLSLRSKSD